jgi:hypothetical protein
MKEDQIKQILMLRYMVYKLGSEKGFWQDIELKGAREMLDYLFVRTGTIAYYHLMLETCRSKHQGQQEFYNLFKLPARIEEEILDYLKENLDLEIKPSISEASEYLLNKANVVVAPTQAPTNIGNLSDHDFDTTIGIIASVYKNAFEQGINNYPYFS